MEKKRYIEPELEIVETPEKDVLDISYDDGWSGTGSGDYGSGWFD